MRAASATDEPPAATKKKAVIVGAGWAGFGAAKHLSEQGVAQLDIGVFLRTALSCSQEYHLEEQTRRHLRRFVVCMFNCIHK